MEAENHLNKEVVNFNSVALPLCPDNQPISKLITPSFEALIVVLSSFKMKCAPFQEAEIENGIERLLRAKRFSVKRQVVLRADRFDLTVGKFIIEAKMVGQTSVVAQLDRYSPFCQGLILICWKASKPLKRIFVIAKSQSKFPIELIEINKSCDVV
jgi:hypothetical protein